MPNSPLNLEQLAKERCLTILNYGRQFHEVVERIQSAVEYDQLPKIEQHVSKRQRQLVREEFDRSTVNDKKRLYEFINQVAMNSILRKWGGDPEASFDNHFVVKYDVIPLVKKHSKRKKEKPSKHRITYKIDTDAYKHLCRTSDEVISWNCIPALKSGTPIATESYLSVRPQYSKEMMHGHVLEMRGRQKFPSSLADKIFDYVTGIENQSLYVKTETDKSLKGWEEPILTKIDKIPNKDECITDIIGTRIITSDASHAFTIADHIGQYFGIHLDNIYGDEGKFRDMQHGITQVKDYITNPKKNGYQSIHMKLMFCGVPIDVQIRSKDMHEFAEKGVAAHMAYKDAADKRRHTFLKANPEYEVVRNTLHQLFPAPEVGSLPSGFKQVEMMTY